MWLSEKLKGAKEKITSSHIALQGGIKPVLSEKGSVNSVFPFGVYSLVPMNTKLISIEDISLGTNSKPDNIPDLEAGETCIYGKGGYILIKNSGEIIINGKKLDI